MNENSNNRLKVLHIISGGDTGGAKTSVITLLKCLKDMIDIKLVCFIESDFTKQAKEEGIDLTIMRQKNRFDMSVVGKLAEYIQRENFDLINCHGARANFIASKLKNKTNVKRITTIHSDYEHDFDNNIYKKILFTMLNKKSLKTFDGFITMAKDFEKDMIRRGFKNIFVAYNGIAKHRSHAEITKEAFCKRQNIPYKEKSFVVGSATRLHPVKGIDVLLKACKVIKDYSEDIVVWIAGYGDEKYLREYEDYIHKNELEETVHLIGFVKDIDAFYQVIDVNTITSHSEAVCYALLEGARFAKPSIGSRVGGIPELIEDNVTGLLFPDNDSKKLAESITKIYEDQVLAQRIGKNLHDKVMTEFTDEAMAKRYVEIYQEMLRG
ncbi:glycosyltransferase family 4 protein [Petrocella sp. FN5]|uniref:glycosyltransferase family 4 protein n=1 Tax=Petrocella sp. FN5 TaxID=3032002 RepID=UPI0023DCCEDB|nr:glycosyltransferase family 4 protein [Petrocella sp. FN5]MDF1617243.1 glycosyltransferase family 4 protein [Petrocella sp. FN5]